MLDAATKRRIDTARDILVGKVPDPKSQVEQITIALIYKFMDDMDLEAEELGGRRKFFAGDFARYGWARLMRSGLGGHETLNLYAEAIAKMPENPGIPPLFRDIFKNAFLPYRDPETLRAFLKVIDEFEYDHSERLGDAFEYLLSVLGSQGDAGQFRTPRHIIDFIVEIVDPKKTETVLDPACGTAGFLISAYKHILKANSAVSIADCGSEAQIQNQQSTIQNLLTPDERGRLAANFKGYDISPDMVRLSLVNMYLHGFTDPHIYEYDTLTSQERWNEYADVILANPPFMSPKGGIKPHNRFSVQSKRSEVLFVDYMAEHLTPGGRAGIIVPEGIIFQSQTAYTQLRKMLVEEYLVAVVSLPAGVFNPYSGVKTSILILDKALARQTDRIAFFKIENDGFSLGAQRRPIDKDDLPEVAALLKQWLADCRVRMANGESNNPQSTIYNPQSEIHNPKCLVVPKAKIAANGDYNLSGERYRENGQRASRFPHVLLGNIAEVRMGETLIKGDLTGTGKPIFSADTSNAPWAFSESTRLTFGRNTLVIGARGTIGSVKFPNLDSFTCTQTTIAVTANTSLVLTEFLYYWLKAFDFTRITEGVGIPMITVANVNKIEIPLPPLEVQKEIVAEIEGYQKVIDGARAVLDNYRPHIPIHPDWPMVALGEVCTFKRGPFGGSLKKEIFVRQGYAVYEQSHAISGSFCDFRYFIDQAKFDEMKGFEVRPGDLIMSCSGTMGRVALVPEGVPRGVINQALLRLTPTDRVLTAFLKLWMESANFQAAIDSVAGGAAIRNVASVEVLKNLKIPLPPLETQRAIVAEIEAEQALVNANRELIARMEKKIQAVLARVWGDDDPAAAEA